MDSIPQPPAVSLPRASTTRLSKQEFSCHCCYEILVNPTTLTCGHNFCRHCLALWWESSYKNECPECREKWEGFPKVNILLRYVFFTSWMRHKVMFGVMARIRPNLKRNSQPFNELHFLSMLCSQRDATDKLFSVPVQRRKAEIQASTTICRSLLAFER